MPHRFQVAGGRKISDSWNRCGYGSRTISNSPGMVGRRARKRLRGAANDSITKFPISGKVPLEWLMHRSSNLSPGHAQSVGGVRDPYSANHSRLWSC
ncbi:hypothetical protein V6N13_057462 [Hibiscus sabdariffa]